MFPNEMIEFEESLHHSFLLWSVSKSPEATASQTVSSVIRSQTLFPLGLALVELSLCRTMIGLHVHEDENPDEQVALPKTANRYLRDV